VSLSRDIVGLPTMLATTKTETHSLARITWFPIPIARITWFTISNKWRKPVYVCC